MNKRRTTTFFTLGLAALILFSSSTKFADAIVDVSWEVGDSYDYLYSYYSYHKIIYQDEYPERTAVVEQNIDLIARTNIAELNKALSRITYTKESRYETYYLYKNYSMGYYQSSLFPDLNDLLHVAQMWDDVENRYVLVNFHFDLEVLQFFLEPDWLSFNNHYKNLLNRSALLSKITNPHNSSETYEFTFGDLLDNAVSYRLMGVKNDLAGAKAKLTADNTRLSFYFDLSHLFSVLYSNGTHNLFFPVDKLEISLELVYRSDGVLDQISYTGESLSSNPETTTESRLSWSYQLGGTVPATKETALPSFYTIGIALGAIIIFQSIYKKKTK